VEPLTTRRAVVALVALSTALTACDGDDSESLPDVVLTALPDFAQRTSELDVKQVDGPAVLNLWATWCVPCRTELPEFQRASGENPGVRFIGIDEGFEPGESVAFLDELGVSYEQFVDTDGAFAEELEVTELPATIVLDADGDVALRHVGPLGYDDLVAVLADVTLATRGYGGERGGRRGRRRCGCGGRT
jgi:thiol-disulfide isomerase/thioredoxin